MKKLVLTNNARIVDPDKEDVICIHYKNKCCRLIAKPEFPINIKKIKLGNMINTCTFELGQFIGLYIGDGWCDNGRKGHNIHIATVHDEIVKTFKDGVNVFLRHGLDKVSGYRLKNREHDFNGYPSIHGKFSISIHRTERIDMIKIFGHKAGNKTFPFSFLKTPEEFRWGLLSGLIDSDGSISHNHYKQSNGKIKHNKDCRYSSTSRELIDRVQLLAFSLGINASVKIVPHASGTIEYIALMSTKHMTEKRSNLKFVLKKYEDILASFTISKRAYYKDFVPFTEEIFNSIKKHNVGISEPKLHIFRKSFRCGYVPRDSIMPFYYGETKVLYDNKFDMMKKYEVIIEI